MRRIAGIEAAPTTARAGVLQNLIALLWAPRQISVRPAFALAASAAVVFVALATVNRTTEVPSQNSAETSDVQLFVQFRLATDASRVQLAGSFTNWEPRYELRQSAPGVWTITVPMTGGVHDYAFVVDGHRWVPDPYAPQIGDGFGGTNSRLSLLPPGPPEL